MKSRLGAQLDNFYQRLQTWARTRTPAPLSIKRAIYTRLVAARHENKHRHGPKETD